MVLSGKARMTVSGEQQEVREGSILYVRATEEHSFFEIEEDMTLLVFFAAML
jgi:quercetin dioxygenase-like cupin family protein